MSDVAPLVREETAAEEERKTSYLELFFDLVFVFAFTQVTALILEDTSVAGVRARGARARDGVVGLVGVRVDDERDRRRERRDAPDHLRGDGGRVLHGARGPRRVPGRGGVVRRRLLRRPRPQLDAVRLGRPRRSRRRSARSRGSRRGSSSPPSSRSSAVSSIPTTARGSGSRRSSSTSSGRSPSRERSGASRRRTSRSASRSS